MRFEAQSVVEDLSLEQSAGNKLNEILKESSTLPVLLLLSGGSAFQLLDQVLEANLSSQTTITVLDERYSHDPKINNFAQLTSLEFYKKALGAGVTFIDTRVGAQESIMDMASRFEEELYDWMQKSPSGKIIATMGMGPDGHTAGIMPFPEDLGKFDSLFDGDRLVVGYDAGDKNEYQKRVTTTFPFLRKIDKAVAIIMGEKKKEAYERLIAENGSLAQTPARVLREMEGDVYLYTDLS